jgi:tetratricopeptide (TPR) repeat protein
MTATTLTDNEARAMTWEQYHEAGRRRFAEGDAAGAEQAFRGAIAEAEQPGGDPLQMASSLSSLGQLKYQQKDYAQAEDCFRRALELREHALGGDHPTVISSINNLAALYVARGALDDAEPLLQRAMAVTIKRVEASQADLAVNLNNLVRLYVKRGDYARAEPMLTQLLAMKRPLGPEHPEVAAVLVTLAKLRQSMSQPDAAERIWRRVLAVRERTLPTNDLTIAATLDGLAEACASQGRTAEELEIRERSFTIREAALGPDHPSLTLLRTRVEELRLVAPPRVSVPTLVEPAARQSPAAGFERRSSGARAVNGVFVPPVASVTDRPRTSNPGTVAPQRPSQPRVSAPAARASGELTPAEGPIPTPADTGRVSNGRREMRSQDIELSVSPTPTAAAPSSMTAHPRPEIRDVPPRKRGFSLHADRIASEAAQPVRVVKPGRGKTIAIVIAAVVVLGAVGFFTFGRDLLSGVLGEPTAAASVAASPTSTSAASGHKGGTASGATTPTASAAPHAQGTAVGVANPSGSSHAGLQTSVTTAPVKPEAAHPKSAAATHAADPDATVIAPPVPNVNVDAATRSIDEATKAATPKPKNTTPF